MGQVTADNIAKVCRYQKPTEEAVVKHEAINAGAEAYIRVIMENTPACADTTVAIRSVREARLWANSAIALGGEI